MHLATIVGLAGAFGSACAADLGADSDNKTFFELIVPYKSVRAFFRCCCRLHAPTDTRSIRSVCFCALPWLRRCGCWSSRGGWACFRPTAISAASEGAPTLPPSHSTAPSNDSAHSRGASVKQLDWAPTSTVQRPSACDRSRGQPAVPLITPGGAAAGAGNGRDLWLFFALKSSAAFYCRAAVEPWILTAHVTPSQWRATKKA